MHYFAAVVIDAGERNVDAAVAKAMAPYQEWSSGDMHGGLWDWYLIGGCWTGVWSGYDPKADPANIETCPQCHGTGHRDDRIGRLARAADPGYTCNGCLGQGRKVKASSEWRRHPGDIVPAAAVLESGRMMPHTVIAPGAPLLKRPWRPEDDVSDAEWDAKVREFLADYREATLVVVDFHR